MNIIEQMLERYQNFELNDRTHALREIMQEIALAGLQRSGFFDKAAFYGGTCLRIFYGLPRFSEDLDFSLLAPDDEFSFKPYFSTLIDEFSALGIEIEISERQKSINSAIVSAFLKKDTSIYDLKIAGQKTLKIKFEVDTNPPLAFATEEKLLLEPYSFYVKCFVLPDLYAGKMHALLFRKWKNRVKGRDWFDFEWYVRHQVPLNLEHLAQRARESGDWQEEYLSPEIFQSWLEERIHQLDISSAKKDISRFISNVGQLDIWSKDYFLALAKRITFK